jgi:hypothetical protein
MVDSVRLSSTVTVKRYREMEKARDRDGLADFIYERLSERYIMPVTSGAKNGFAMMACACLLIETLESFYNGWRSTEGISPVEAPFRQFFNREARFASFHNDAESFYKGVRCGLLHQGETKGGWRVSRKLGAPVFDSKTKMIQATKFLNRLHASLRTYRDALKKADWKGDLWGNFRRKMNNIIQHCEAKS